MVNTVLIEPAVLIELAVEIEPLNILKGLN